MAAVVQLPLVAVPPVPSVGAPLTNAITNAGNIARLASLANAPADAADASAAAGFEVGSPQDIAFRTTYSTHTAPKVARDAEILAKTQYQLTHLDLLVTYRAAIADNNHATAMNTMNANHATVMAAIAALGVVPFGNNLWAAELAREANACTEAAFTPVANDLGVVPAAPSVRWTLTTAWLSPTPVSGSRAALG